MMSENNDTEKQFHEDCKEEPKIELLKLAKDANESGDFLLSMFLYLAAFQKSSKSSQEPDPATIDGLKQAWELACESKERSLAEYIFELLEPYLGNDEIVIYTDKLQALAFDRLEELGISRADIDEMAQLISDELVSVNPSTGLDGLFDGFLPVHSKGIKLRKSSEADGEDGSGDQGESPVADLLDGSIRDAMSFYPEGFAYSDIAGYSRAIDIMKEFGIGNGSDPSYSKLLDMLNYRHGLTSAPASDTILLRSDAREDANRFMVATVGELGLPAVHMRMEEGFQGSPLLCISTHGISNPSPMALRETFASGGILVLENLDLWESPMMEMSEDGNPFLMMQMTRGAREAMSMVRSAVDDPNVTVLATSSSDGMIDEFFLELLEPLAFVDISLPDETDRMDIWMDISRRHPSFRQLNKKELVRYSDNMPRFDIYLAAREALEEAYKAGVAYKRYIPVTRENVLDKLACYHSVGSEQYRELEEELIKDFQAELEDIEDKLL